MKRALSDFSQLSKAMFKSAPAQAEVKPEPPKPSKAGDEVLAYFLRSGAAGAQDAQKAPVSAPAADGANARMGELEGLVAALRAQLRDSETEQKDAVERLEAAERKCADGAAAMAAAQKDLVRLQGECGRLQGELRKAAPLAEQKKIADRFRAKIDEVALYRVKLERAINSLREVYDQTVTEGK